MFLKLCMCVLSRILFGYVIILCRHTWTLTQLKGFKELITVTCRSLALVTMTTDIPIALSIFWRKLSCHSFEVD